MKQIKAKHLRYKHLEHHILIKNSIEDRCGILTRFTQTKSCDGIDIWVSDKCCNSGGRVTLSPDDYVTVFKKELV